jgi:FecR-like protein
MKKVSALLALTALFFAGLAFANTATVTSSTGTVQVQTGTAPARVLRTGDLVRQGDTITTGPVSSAVLKFEDGQIAALTANSKMTVSAYQYNPQTGGGSVLLSLIDGGMRAITGLIGRRTPNNVAYRAATATIGIRGTDVTIVTSQGNVVVSVTDGVISFAFPGQPPQIVSQGNAVSAVNGSVAQGAAALIINALPPEMQVPLSLVPALTAAINAAAAGTATTIVVPPAGTQTGQPAGGIGASGS